MSVEVYLVAEEFSLAPLPLQVTPAAGKGCYKGNPRHKTRRRDFALTVSGRRSCLLDRGLSRGSSNPQESVQRCCLFWSGWVPSDILCGGILAALCSAGTHRHSPRRFGALSLLPHRGLVFARRAPARKLLHGHSLRLRHRLRPALCRNDGRTSRMAGTQFTCLTCVQTYKY